MKLCSQCRHSVWPFVFALFIAAFAAFLTWMTLYYSRFDTVERLLLTGGVFVAAAATLIHYMLSCMRRHCRHDDHGHPDSHGHAGG